MAYQLSTIITSVRKRAKDLSFDADLITEYIQETQNKVLERSRFRFMEVSATDNVTESSTGFTPADEVEVVLELKLNATTGSQRVKPKYVSYPQFIERFDYTSVPKSVPRFFTIYGNEILFDAPLDQDYSYSIKYIKIPATLSDDTDVPNIPVRFREILIRGGLAGVEEYRENFDIAALHERRIEELAEDMLVRLSTRQLITTSKAKFGRTANDDAF